jgi:deferrochelatase/peroxidase EfeB
VSLNRRQFLRQSGLGVVGAVTGVAASSTDVGAADRSVSVMDAQHGPAELAPVRFHGVHQAGILTPQPPAAAFVAFDVIAADRNVLAELFKMLTSRARFLTTGGVPPLLRDASPPSDSGTLGPRVPADGLTVTLGVGSTLFDERYGLGASRPKYLEPMRAFPNDDLDPAWSGGDVLVQFCAGSADVVLHALRDIAKHTRGAMQVRWRLDGYLSPPRPTGVPRDNLGFMDGIANPRVDKSEVADKLLWVVPESGEPKWAIGGTYHVLRLIRMFIEFWDRVSLAEQQNMIGRYRGSGAPLGMTSYRQVPDYAKDRYGLDVPLTAHIRVANPRTEATESSRIFRRSYNYDLGVDVNGDLNMGHAFNCFQQNVARQFEAVQKRLVNEALDDYVSPFGGGYFFALPGVRDEHDYYGRGLLT